MTDIEDDYDGSDPLVKQLLKAKKNFDLQTRRREAAESKLLDINTVLEKALPPPPSGEVAEHAIDRLVGISDSGKLVSKPIKPGNEYPILFTRLPIFIPSRRIKQKNDLMDINTAVKFSCVFGSGVRKGPPLTTFDEDVFMALLRLRQSRVRGLPEDLPLRTEPDESLDNVEVDHLVCQTSDIFRILELENNGQAYDRVKTSVKNLAATTIELEKRIVDRYFGTLYRGRAIRLYDLKWCLGEEQGVFEIQFAPVVTRWLVREFAYVDWSVRRQLKAPLTKALHRFLSSQNTHYSQGLKKIADAVGYAGPSRNISARFKSALDELVSVRFLKSYAISGTGRSTPLTLEIFR